MTDSEQNDALIQKSLDGDEAAFAELFDRFRPRLKRMVSLRMHPRVQQRVDASDVLQEAFIDMARRLDGYAENQEIDFYVWMRLVTGQRLGMIHRQHLDAHKRNARVEKSINRGRVPEASTFCLASRLIGQFSSVGEQAVRAERQRELEEVLEGMDPDDREVLALKHFEEMSNSEMGQVLGISDGAASKRYIRALRRLQQAVKQKNPSLFDTTQIG